MQDPFRLCCPRCGHPVSAVRAGQLTFAAAMLRVEDDGSLSARCAGDRCSEVIPLPFLSITMPPPPPTTPGRRRLVARLPVDKAPRSA